MSTQWTKENAQNFVSQIELRAKIEALQDILCLTGKIARKSIKTNIEEFARELRTLVKP